MNNLKWAMLVLCCIADSLWAMSIWGGWAEKTLATVGDRTWGILRLLRISATKNNKILLVKITSAIGIAIVTFGTVCVLIYQ
jgi:hypothetical protein